MLVEIIIVSSLFFTYLLTETKVPLVKRAINGLLLVLIFGIPIFFTSITRSVFEVNKLLLLRVTTLLIVGLWIIQSWWVDYDKKDTSDGYRGKPFYEWWGVKWFKTGLEIPLLIWLVVNLVSTALSQNLFVSIIGAYDRWEGILTVVNYAVLILIFAKQVDSLRFFYWIFFSFIVSAAMSAIYGIFQSNGLDFMQWSSDATSRAFGSINNPVHYGPFVGMMIPLAFGYMIQIKRFQSDMGKVLFHSLYFLSFILTLVIYYAMFTSWGRGTWLGFQGAITIFLLFISRLVDERSKKQYFADFLVTIAMVGLMYVMLLFRVYALKPLVMVPVMVILFGGYGIWVFRSQGWLNVVERVAIVLMIYQIQLIPSGLSHVIIYFSLLTVLMVIHNRVYRDESIFMRNKLISVVLFSFGFILFSPTIIDFLLYLLVLTVAYGVRQLYVWAKDKSLVMVGSGFLFIFLAVLVIPQHSFTGKLFNNERKSSSNVLITATGKTSTYKSEAIGGHSPRMSMWKSGISWGLHNPVFGTGPDTIKEMYPFYRRVEYARLEGGYNLTPDRLHNEYVNTFATTGFLGVVGRYGLVIGMYLYLLLNYLYKNREEPSFYLLLSTLCGVFFYQGQVLFNFGVVATTSLNYMLMGLGLAIGYYSLGNRYDSK